MADRMCTEIKIGGKISRSLLPALFEAITFDDASPGWGDDPLQPTVEDDLQEAMTSERHLEFQNDDGDGEYEYEASRTRIRQEHSRLTARLRHLQAALGRAVTEEEAYDWQDARDAHRKGQRETA
jgi:hypothetical protein